MIEFAIHTHVGERDNNEDSLKVIYNEEVGYCFVVADGLGGHSRGEDASRYTVEMFEEEFMNLNNNNIETEENKDDNEYKDNNEDEKDEDKVESDNNIEETDIDTDENEHRDETKECDKSVETIEYKESSMQDFLKNAFEKAQKKLEKEQDKTGALNELKTTAVALTIADDKMKWAHIGDSRIYMFNKNKVVIRSLDHSVPQMLVFAGELKEKNIRNHPDRNRLLRVLGARNVELKVDFSEEYTLDDCQAFLLCSDGFWECITEKKMCKFLRKSKNVNEWLEMMVKEVKKNGKGTNMDNNSAIAVWVKEKRSGILWM